MNSELPNGYRQIPNGETLAFGYVIYGEKNVAQDELFPIDNKYTHQLKAPMAVWNSIARINGRPWMSASYIVMTNEQTLTDRSCYSKTSNPPPRSKIDVCNNFTMVCKDALENSAIYCRHALSRCTNSAIMDQTVKKTYDI